MNAAFSTTLFFGCLLFATASQAQSFAANTGSMPATSVASAQVIRGEILTEDGQPLPGATVLLKGTKQVFSTNADGQYAFTTTMPAQAVRISLMGYADVEVTVRPKEHNSTILQMLPGTRVKKGKLLAVGHEAAE